MSDVLLPCATWNVHRAVGRDGRLDGARVVEAIAEEIAPLGPRVIALQEADSDDHPHGALLDRAALAAATGLRSVHDVPEMRWGEESGGFLGNVLLVDPAIDLLARRIVELPGRVPRAAVMVELGIAGRALRVMSCHLSLSQGLRAIQLRLLGQVAARRAAMQTLLMGDLNEWRPWGGLALSRRVSGMALAGPARRTFPARAPVLPLDRILTGPEGAVEAARALEGARIRAASDHRPLFARVRLGGGAA